MLFLVSVSLLLLIPNPISNLIFSPPHFGGVIKMIQSLKKSCQWACDAWSWDKLLWEWAITLRHAIDTSTLNSYSFALNSYLTFMRIHDLPIELTPDTLSFYTVFMSHHIEPWSVWNYLSGICQQLKPYFPNIHPSCHSPLVDRTLKAAFIWEVHPQNANVHLLLMTFQKSLLVYLLPPNTMTSCSKACFSLVSSLSCNWENLPFQMKSIFRIGRRLASDQLF